MERQVLIPFVLTTLIYCIYAAIPYIDKLKSNTYAYYAIGIILAIIGNSLWLYIAKATTDNNLRTIYGIIFDSIVTAAFIIIPVLLFNVKLTGTTLIGVGLLIAGLVVLKIGHLL